MGGAPRHGARHMPTRLTGIAKALYSPKGRAWWCSNGRITPRRAGPRSWRRLPGWGMSADAADLVAPTLEGAARAIRACLTDANLSVDAVDYINAHGTGTIANDITEVKVIKAVFGAQAKRLSISSTKSMHDHALGASGALELIAVIEAIRRGIVPPTINIEELDPDFDQRPGE
jgi:nodulation protein E